MRTVSLSNKIASNVLISYAGRIVGSALALVVVGIITRSLGQEGFGQYTTVFAFISLFVILADLGLQSLLTREISKAKAGFEKIASNFFSLRLLGSLFFLLTGVIVSFFFPYSMEVKIGIGIGAVGFFFLSINQLLLSVFQKHLAMHVLAIAEVVGRVAQLFFVYLIYKQTHNQFFWFLAAMSASALIIFCVSFVFAQKYIKIRLSFDFKYWLEIIKDTWPIALSIVLTLVYFKIDTIFLSLMKPQADVGIYGIAYRVLESLIFFPAMFAGIMMPFFSRDAVFDPKRFKEIFAKSLRIIAIFAYPVIAGGIILSYSITNFIGGEEFLVAGGAMQVLFIATGLIFFGNILGRAIIALDLQKKAVFAYLSGVVLNVVLNLIFIPKYTYMGAAWTTVVTEFLIVVFLFWIVWRKTKARLDIKNIIKTAFAAAVMSGALLIFVSPITVPLSFLGLAAYIAVGAGIYFGTLYLTGGINKEEIESIFRTPQVRNIDK